MPDSSIVLPPGYLTESPIEFFCVCFNIDSWALLTESYIPEGGRASGAQTILMHTLH